MEIKNLHDVMKWHRQRIQFFSHGGVAWGAMARDSKAILDVLELTESLLLEMEEALDAAHGGGDD